MLFMPYAILNSITIYKFRSAARQPLCWTSETGLSTIDSPSSLRISTEKETLPTFWSWWNCFWTGCRTGDSRWTRFWTRSLRTTSFWTAASSPESVSIWRLSRSRRCCSARRRCSRLTRRTTYFSSDCETSSLDGCWTWWTRFSSWWTTDSRGCRYFSSLL